MDKQMELRAAVARLFYGNDSDSRDFNMLIDFIDSSFQQKGVHWIPVTERLPKKEDANRHGEVLVWLRGARTHHLWRLEQVIDHPDCITHWMPLPEQPKEEA